MAWTMVTGASAGLGAEYARQLAEAGHNVVLVARRADALEELAGQLRARCGVEIEVLVADLGEREQLERVAQRIGKDGKRVDLLVNNAGFALAQPFVGGRIEREENALDVMVRAVMVLSHAAANSMVERGHGAILNVSSVAAGTAMGTYAAHKTWVNIFSEALATELSGRGVTVTSVRPGTIDTDFFDVFGMRATDLPRFIVLQPEQVVRESLRAVSRGKVEIVPGGFYRAVDWLRQKAARPLVRKIAGHSAGAPLQI